MIRGFNEALQEYSLRNKGGNSSISNFKSNKSDAIQMLAAIGSYHIDTEIQDLSNIDIGEYIQSWNKEGMHSDEVKSFLSHPNHSAYVIEAFNLSGNNQSYKHQPENFVNHQNIISSNYLEKRWSNTSQENQQYRNDYKPYYHAEHSKDYRHHSYRYGNEYYRNVNQKRPSDNYSHKYNQN